MSEPEKLLKTKLSLSLNYNGDKNYQHVNEIWICRWKSLDNIPPYLIRWILIRILRTVKLVK